MNGFIFTKEDILAESEKAVKLPVFGTVYSIWVQKKEIKAVDYPRFKGFEAEIEQTYYPDLTIYYQSHEAYKANSSEIETLMGRAINKNNQLENSPRTLALMKRIENEQVCLYEKPLKKIEKTVHKPDSFKPVRGDVDASLKR